MNKITIQEMKPRAASVSRCLSALVCRFLLVACATLAITISTDVLGQKRKGRISGSHPRVVQPAMTPATRALIEDAIGVVCAEAKLDPKGSVPIDEMQSRPSLPVQRPEAQAGAALAQKLLPVAKTLVINSLHQLVTEYGFQDSARSAMGGRQRRSALRNTSVLRRSFLDRLKQAISRVEAVRRIRPDTDSRDNASVLLSRPHTILFGTIFLASLPSNEGMISVLSHELMHIADGDSDSLRPLVARIANRAAKLTGLDIGGQRGEELTCDLVGAMAVRAYVAETPDYESITRRLARSIEHNCVELDEGDDDHLSPRNTIRALLALNPVLVRELINDREERAPGHRGN